MQLRGVLLRSSSNRLTSSFNWPLSRAASSAFSSAALRHSASSRVAKAALPSLSSFARCQLISRAFHSSSCACASHGRQSAVSGTSGIWSAGAADGADHERAEIDKMDLLQHTPGKFEYLDVHLPPAPPLPTHPYVDNQLARLSAIEQQQHLLRRAIEERQRLHFAESQRRQAEDVYNDPKNWLGGEEEPKFNLWELFADGMRILILGTLASFTIYFFLLPFGKLLGVPVPNPALALILRAYHGANSLLETAFQEKASEMAGKVYPQYEREWLNALADKVIFKLKNPGAPLPLQNKVFVFPVVVQLAEGELSSKQEIEETLQSLTHTESAQH